ncbi:MAG TPA: enoyl-CoA hydratase/isomerase family protein [Dehalococcoidia bacterium]|nr:enoyl-CoA hydratase/isomerase family protein [Dehalococcoidia bacterium]
MYEAVKLERDGLIAVISLNRPERLNAVDSQLTADFHRALDDVAEDEGIRVVILTGEGRGFCSGADVTGMRARAEGSPQTAPASPAQGAAAGAATALPVHMRRIPQPVIGAINGVASGMGLSIALACDFRIASDQARFASIFIKRSFMPDNGATFLLTHLAGPGIAAEMALTGNVYEADWALQKGLVNKVVPHAQLLDEARSYAEAVAGNPPIAVRMTKQLLQRGLLASLEEAIRAESEGNNLTRETEDWREAVLSFLEKRPAVFKGR